MTSKILVMGAAGQIGTELVEALRKKHGSDAVLASDIHDLPSEGIADGPYERLDVLDAAAMSDLIDRYGVEDVYLLAATLSATAERNPETAWRLNMDGLFNVLNLAKDQRIKRVFWPSSIAVFGPRTPKDHTPQRTVMEPTTVYGISKVAGESWCEYYHDRYGVDVRSVRFPGIIGYKSAPGGGTTDYAVHIFHEALKHRGYESFISAGTALPMMYMPDAIKSVMDLMDAPADRISVRTSYNISGMSFSPQTIAEAIQKHIPEFEISYKPDYRDGIAKSWPSSIDDEFARRDWGWKPQFGLNEMVADMLANLRAAQPA